MAGLFLTETGGSQPPAPGHIVHAAFMLQHAVHFKAETPVADYDVVKQVNRHKIRTFLQPLRYLYVRF